MIMKCSLTCWRVWQPNKWHPAPCRGPLAAVLWPHEGEGTTHPPPILSLLKPCARSKPRWTKPSPLVLTSRVQTPRLFLAPTLPMCSCMVTWLLALARPGLNCSMAVGALLPPKAVSMLFSLSMAALVSMSFRRTISGSSTTMVPRFPSSLVCALTESFLQFFTLTDTLMTESRTVTFTNVIDNQEQTVTFPDYNRAAQFVLSLHIAGVKAVVNLLPEDVAWERINLSL